MLQGLRGALALLLAGMVGCGGGPRELPLGKAALERALGQLRPDSAHSLRIRACLKWRLGQRRPARREALIGLLVDPSSAAGCRQAGAMELALGKPGAALALLERAHAQDVKDPAVRQALASLLLTRAEHRVTPRVGLLQLDQAGLELRRAVRIHPAFGPRACRIKAQLEWAKQQTSRPGGWSSLRRLGGDPFRDNVNCPGPPRGLGASLPALSPREYKCKLPRPTSFLPRLRRRYLLLGCAGAQLGLRLERWGCLDQALEVWEALATEAPGDPRWPLQAARVHLARGEAARAEPLLTSHVFLAPGRSQAMLAAARIQLLAGNKAHAARRATRAVELAADPVQALAGIKLMGEAGYAEEARLTLIRVAARFPGALTVPR